MTASLNGHFLKPFDCSQSPIFPWDFRDLIELPPSLFVRASATWGECLNYRGGPGQVTLRSVKNRGTVTTSDSCSQSPLYQQRQDIIGQLDNRSSKG